MIRFDVDKGVREGRSGDAVNKGGDVVTGVEMWGEVNKNRKKRAFVQFV